LARIGLSNNALLQRFETASKKYGISGFCDRYPLGMLRGAIAAVRIGLKSAEQNVSFDAVLSLS